MHKKNTLFLALATISLVACSKQDPSAGSPTVSNETNYSGVNSNKLDVSERKSEGVSSGQSMDDKRLAALFINPALSNIGKNRLIDAKVMLMEAMSSAPVQLRSKQESINKAHAYSAVATAPTRSWEVKTDASLPVADKKIRARMNEYMRMFEVGICITDKLGAEVADNMNAYTYHDASKANAFAEKITSIIENDHAENVADQCELDNPLNSKNSREPDYTGFQGVAWQNGDVRYECALDGCKKIVGGVMQFGQGAYSGGVRTLTFNHGATQSNEGNVTAGLGNNYGVGTSGKASVSIPK